MRDGRNEETLSLKPFQRSTSSMAGGNVHPGMHGLSKPITKWGYCRTVTLEHQMRSYIGIGTANGGSSQEVPHEKDSHFQISGRGTLLIASTRYAISLTAPPQTYKSHAPME